MCVSYGAGEKLGMKRWIAIVCMFANYLWPVIAKTDSDKSSPSDMKLIRLDGDSTARLRITGKEVILRKGETSGQWTLVEVLTAKAKTWPPYAVLEDYL